MFVCRVEVDTTKYVKGKESCLISLINGRSFGRTLNIEYASCETIDENRNEAILWANALKICIERAQTKARNYG